MNVLSVADIFKLIFGRNSLHHYIAMWKVYLDESGNDPNEISGVFVMAGFFGTEQGFDMVESQWMKALTPLSGLHTAVFLNEPLDSDFKKAKLQLLADVMLNCPLVAPVVATVSWNDHRKLIHGKLIEKYSTPYMLCSQIVIASILKVLPPDERIAFVMEYEQKNRQAIRDLEQVFFTYQTDPRLVGITQFQKNQCVCIQPADYLAYAALQRYREGNRYPSSFQALATSPILRNGNVAGVNVDDAMLEQFVTELRGQ